MKINLKQISLALLTMIVLIQVYINFCVPEGKKRIKKIEPEDLQSSIEPQTYVNTIDSETEKNTLFDKYGKPDHISENNGVKVCVWNFQNPKPWNILVNDPSLKFPLIFGFKYNLGENISKLKKWKNVIPNLEYKNNILYLPSKDEESSLALLNLILSNLNDELLFEEIINNNLIPISVNKIKSHQLIKNKILEQIMEKVSTETDVNSADYATDLADTDNDLKTTKVEDIDAYGGGEFTFL